MKTEPRRNAGWGWSGLLWAACLLGVADGWAAERIKLATLAPTGSTYHKSLLVLREAWRKASQGSLDLVVYADGKLGGEADTVGLMGVNSIQAAMLTGVGLSEIEKAVTGLQSLPMGFRDFAEVDYVGERLQPMLEERLAAKGFMVLFWTDAGWVRFFSKKPVARPDDLKKLKLFTWAGSPEQVELYRFAGFNPVPLETADILPSLQTGLIEATPAPPVFALAGQIDGRAPYMLDINWAPLVGACVIRKATWEKIPAALRPALLEASRLAGREIKASGRKEMEESVAAMTKRGLTVTRMTPELEAEWRSTAEAVYPKIRGKLVPEDIFDTTLRLIRECRSQPAAR
ncbi:MAG TPA: TRAP transporter substrate-binding protein DctP [Verrucomicrobiota bacterium]|nr:TRAP transporter substrate-binding protein DctP [Verrucomicrobiota bacterium]HNU51917.1 TRAP transporter substrate-binding protein DctP [Verrucomicrobiota bacterium]